MGGLLSVIISATVDLVRWLLASGTPSIDESDKFQTRQGVTLYDAVGSPCARRVRMVLMAKGMSWNRVEIDLLGGEQNSDDYLKVNPQGKVPAVTFKDVEGFADCTLVESQVITEYIDRQSGGQLYPADPWLRTQTKMWIDWEQSLSEDFFPLLNYNYLPFLLRLFYWSRDHFIACLPKHIPKNTRQKKINLYDGQKVKSIDQMKLHAVGCYRALLKLEKTLQDRSFLVADRITMADLAIYPRLAMFELAGLPIPSSAFPSTVAYLQRLSSIPCVRNSLPCSAKMLACLFVYMPGFVVWLGNLRAGHSHQRFDGSKVIERVLGEDGERTSLELPLQDMQEEKFVVLDHMCSAESWQAQLVLLEKGESFRMEARDFLEMVARPHGSESIYQVQHGEEVVSGRRAQLEYLDWAAGGKELLPEDNLERAQVQMWQTWEAQMYMAHIYPLMETTLLPAMFKQRFSPDQADDLLRLRSDPFYSVRFLEILHIYSRRWEPGSDILRQLSATVGLDLDRDPEVEVQQTLEHHWELHRCLEQLDCHLKVCDFLVGGRLTLADICVYCRLLLMPYINMKISGQKYQHVARWMTSLWERETFRQVATQVTENLDRYITV